MRQGSTIIKTNKTKGSRTTKDSFGCNYSDLLEAAFDKKQKRVRDKIYYYVRSRPHSDPSVLFF